MLELIKECFTWLPLRDYFKSPEYREYIRLSGKYMHTARFRNAAVRFLHYRIEVSDCLSFLHQYKDIFVERIYEFESSSSAPLIYDCGANYGISCLYFKSLYPACRIKAFEADTQIAQLLKKNISSNAGSNVEIFNKAVWTQNGFVEFGVEGADGGAVGLAGGEKIKVESVRLKELIEAEKKIDMLKVDIEGAEVEVIADCAGSLNRVENIFIEYHSRNNSPQGLDLILKALAAAGFRYYIETVCQRPKPFVNRLENSAMDMQLNIFAYRRNPLK